MASGSLCPDCLFLFGGISACPRKISTLVSLQKQLAPVPSSMKIFKNQASKQINALIKTIGLVEDAPAFSVRFFPVGYPFINVAVDSKIQLSTQGEKLSTHSYVCGQALSNFEMSLAKVKRILIIQFHPQVLHKILATGGLDFYDQQIPLALVDQDLAHQLEDLVAAPIGPQEVIQKVERLILSRYDKTPIDKRVFYIWNAMLKSAGKLNLKELADKCNLTERRLQQLFIEDVGIPQKKYMRIVRFQKLVYEIILNNTKKVYTPDGYFDQSHFISDIKKLSGMTPQQFVQYLKNPVNRMSCLEANLFHHYHPIFK